MPLLQAILQKEIQERKTAGGFDKFKDSDPPLSEPVKANFTKFMEKIRECDQVQVKKMSLSKTEECVVINMQKESTQTMVGFALKDCVYIDPQLLGLTVDNLSVIFSTKPIYLMIGYPIVYIYDKDIRLCLYSQNNLQKPIAIVSL